MPFFDYLFSSCYKWSEHNGLSILDFVRGIHRCLDSTHNGPEKNDRWRREKSQVVSSAYFHQYLAELIRVERHYSPQVNVNTPLPNSGNQTLIQCNQDANFDRVPWPWKMPRRAVPCPMTRGPWRGRAVQLGTVPTWTVGQFDWPNRGE